MQKSHFSIYPRTLWVAVGKEDIKDIVSHLVNRDGSKLTKDVVPDDAFGLTMYVTSKDRNKDGYLVWVENDAAISVIAHEATHVAIDLCSETGIKLDINNQEPIAYIVGWIANKIQEAITKSKK